VKNHLRLLPDSLSACGPLRSARI